MKPAACRGGVFVAEAATADRILEGGGSRTVWAIDGAVANTRESLFAALASALRFPGYFGRNWDATYDCLTGLAGGELSSAVLLITDAHLFLDGMGDEWPTAQRVFSDAAAFWQGQGR